MSDTPEAKTLEQLSMELGEAEQALQDARFYANPRQINLALKLVEIARDAYNAALAKQGSGK